MKALPLVRHNIIANYSGRAWTSLLSLAFVPLYIKLMGVEVYGLLGIFMSLGALISLLDMGLSATLSRELPRLSTVDDSAKEARNLVRTFEVVYWGTGVVIGVAVALLAPLIARYWINTGKVDRDTVGYALMVMGMSIAFQWPGGLYSGGLMGLQRQVALNVIRSAMVTVQHVGAVLILLLVSPTILAFFFWQSFVGLLTTIALGIWVWKSLPKSNGAAKFERALLVKNWRFATGMTGISLVTMLLTQLDKIILSKWLSLEAFGYYMLAFNVANSLNNFSFPIYSALLPKFTQLVASGDMNGLASLYHKGARLLSALMLPVAMTVIFFSNEILAIWLNNPVVSENAQPILVLLMIGTAFNAMMVVPFSLQLAHGWTRFSIYKNLIASVFLVPLLLVLINRYQGIGAAIVWLILNLGYLAIEVPIMHRRLLTTEMRNWYRYDIIQPLLLVTVVTLCFHMAMPDHASRLITFSWILITLMFSFAVAAWSTGYLGFKKLMVGAS